MIETELYNDFSSQYTSRGDKMIELNGNNLTLDQAARVVFSGEPVEVAEETRVRVSRMAARVEQIVAAGTPVYGINTGFGKLSTKSIPRDHLRDLQRNIVLSHSVGVGEPLPVAAVRAMMLFRINSLLKGASGIRMETLDYLIDLLNAGIHPVVPAQGSVGSSGDLASLAHIALILLGKGEAIADGARISGAEALNRIGRAPLELAPKEGLALLNGTQYMTGVGFLLYTHGMRLLNAAIGAAALSLEGLRGFSAPFSAKLHAVRPHPGQVRVAEMIRDLTAGSSLLDSAHGDVQDAYSLRCLPQVLGPAQEALQFLKEKLEIEINSATDNPLLFADGTVLSGGNFHGEILGLALEMVTLALSEVGNIAERRIDRLLNSPERGLPPFLVKESGINSGLMLVQYTAAALASENKILCHPALADSIPTSGGKEDHNSMAAISARKGIKVCENLARIIAIEYLCAAQALDFQGVEKMGQKTRALYDRVRRYTDHVEHDRPLAPEIERLSAAVMEGEITDGLV